MGHICGWMQRKHSTCMDTWIWILRKATNDTSNRVKIPNFQTMIVLWVCTTCTKSFLINLIAPLRIACTRDPRGYVVGGAFSHGKLVLAEGQDKERFRRPLWVKNQGNNSATLPWSQALAGGAVGVCAVYARWLAMAGTLADWPPATETSD